MANTSDGRIAILERRCEMLAAKLGLSCDQLDKVWPDYQTSKAGNAPVPPVLTPKNGA